MTIGSGIAVVGIWLGMGLAFAFAPTLAPQVFLAPAVATVAVAIFR